MKQFTTLTSLLLFLACSTLMSRPGEPDQFRELLRSVEREHGATYRIEPLADRKIRLRYDFGKHRTYSHGASVTLARGKDGVWRVLRVDPVQDW